MPKHLSFSDTDGQAENCLVFNDHTQIIGTIEYYPRWKEWVYFSSVPDVVLSAGCMREIIEKIDELNKEFK
jgi:hypothetical protein